MFQEEYVEKIKTHILCSIFFFSKILPFMRNVEKILYSRAGHIWQHNMAHSPCALDT